MVNNLITLIESHKMERVTEDRWMYRRAPDENFSTQAAYSVILGKRFANLQLIDSDLGLCFESIWITLVPAKVIPTAWRLLWDRLPTRDNLRRRKILQDGDNLSCPFCNSSPEFAAHSFFECHFSY